MVNYPTKKETEKLCKDFAMPDNIRRHSELVAEVAAFLGKELKNRGIDIDLELLKTAASLHDLFRAVDIKSYDLFDVKPRESETKIWESVRTQYPGKSHHEIAFEFFKDQYPEMALMIRKHVYKAILNDPPVSWEEKVLNYSDKRVAHDQIVTLKARLIEGNVRYLKRHPELVPREGANKRFDKALEALEDEIFSLLQLKPNKLEEYMLTR